MSEPITSSSAAVAASGMVATASAVTLFTGIDAGVLYGALAGSTLFVVSSRDLSIRRRVIYMILSTVLAVVCSQFVSDLLGLMIRKFEPGFVVQPSVGAALAGAVVVNGLLWLIDRARHPDQSFQSGVTMWRNRK